MRPPFLAYRYILREIFPYFIIAALVLTLIIFARQAGTYAELFVKKNVPSALVQTLLWSMLPRILIITLPISLLISILVALGRMSSDNELVSLLACGISRLQIAWPVMAFAMAVLGVTLYLSAVDLHQSARRFRQIRSQLIVQGIRTQMKARVFDARFVDKTVYIRDINRRNDIWDRIFLVSAEEGGRRPTVITARRGILDLGESPDTSQLNLFDGYVHRMTEEDGRPVYTHEGFTKAAVRFDAKSRESLQIRPDDMPGLTEQIHESSIPELAAVPAGDPRWVTAQTEMNERLAIPFACVIFALIGLALGVTRSRSGRSYGFILSIAVVVVYYLLYVFGRNLARSLTVAPGPAVWGANVIFGILAIMGLRETRVFARWEQYPLHWVHWVTHWWGRRRPLGGFHFLRVNRLSRWEFAGIGVLNGYVGVQFFRLLVLTVTGFLAVFMIFTVFELSSDLVKNDIPWSYTAEYLVNLTPLIVNHVVPPSILISALTLFAVLTRFNEIAAFKASGVSTYRLAAPLVILCGVLGGALFLLQDRVLPQANERQDRLRYYIRRGHPPDPSEFAPNANPGNWFFVAPDRIIHFRRYQRGQRRLDSFEAFFLDPSSFEIRERWEARAATWLPELKAWELTSGTQWRFSREHIADARPFDTHMLPLSEDLEYFDREMRRPDYLSRAELRKQAAELEKSGLDNTELLISLNEKSAYPLACVAMGLAGVPFGLTFGRRGGLFGMGFGMAIGFAYWSSLSFFAQLGRYDYISPTLAAWSPNGLYGALGLYFLLKTRT